MENRSVNYTYSKTEIFMDTLVSIKVVTAQSEKSTQEKMAQAFEAFRRVENHCSRFDPNSELRQISTQIGRPVKVTELLYQVIHFALEVSTLTEGAYDPTIGGILTDAGFNKNYLTGERVKSPVDGGSLMRATYKDVILDEQERTITLMRPLLLDLGAAAKGLAIDLAAKELESFEGYSVDAGGDIYVSGLNEHGKPWVIGIRHPINKEDMIDTIQINQGAVCTSGSYERVSKVKKNTHHLIDPKSKDSAKEILSCTAIAPFAMMADAFSTAAFIMGAKKGLQLFEENGLEGLIMTVSQEKKATTGWGGYHHD